MKKKVNWGIIGLGKIAGKFADDLLKVENARLYAVASRTKEKAEKFAASYQAHKSYGSYEDLAKDPNIDIVYIATPHPYHKENAILCLKNKIGVLCEKPFAMNTEEVEQMIETAKNNDTFLMEALWTRFLPNYNFVKELVDSGKFGAIKHIEADFGFDAEFDPQGRLYNMELGGGSFLDIGIYPVFLAFSLLGYPETIKAEATFAETGADKTCRIHFTFKNGASAELYSTIEENTPTTGKIILENGEITMLSRFHEPSDVQIESQDQSTVQEFKKELRGYYHEALHAGECILQDKKESDLWPLSKSLEFIKLLDEIRDKAEIHY